MKKIIKPFILLFIIASFSLFSFLGIKAEADTSKIIVALEQQEATDSSGDCTSIRYIATISNVDALSSIDDVDLNLTLYKYNSSSPYYANQSVDTTKLYTSVSGTNGKSASDGVFYAVFTITDPSMFNDYTLTASVTVNFTNGLNTSSEEVSYTINDSGDTFIKSMDASAVPALESVGVKYYNYGSSESEDVYKILADNGVNYIRVRIWNDPYDSDGNGYGGGNCDLTNAIAIGKRANKYGMKILADFQYSDFWADPGKQILPKAWRSYSTEQIQNAVYSFTKESLTTMKNAGIDIGMVQVGNETNDSMCGLMGEEGTMSTICSFMAKGSKAVREVYPDALVALHFANPSNSSNYYWYASELNSAGVDYDVFGTSYYPYWHGSQSNLTTVLTTIATTYNKKVMILETSYANCEMEDSSTNSDGYGNTVYTKAYTESENESNAALPYAFTVAGQKQQVEDLMDLIANIKDSNNQYGIGISYWEGTWISTAKYASSLGITKEQLWNTYGTGWAATYASGYYEYFASNNSSWLSTSGQSASDFVISSAGGCVIENEAFFNEDGQAFASIQAFKHTVSCTKNVTDDLVATEKNLAELLDNGNFETTVTSGSYTYPDFTNWNISYDGTNVWGDKSTWIKNGSYSYGLGGQSLTADINQDVSGGTGTYTLSVNIATTDLNSGSTVTLYVSINGVKTTTSCTNTSLKTLQTFTTSSFTVKSTDTVVIGVSISGSSSYVEFYIDDFAITKK